MTAINRRAEARSRCIQAGIALWAAGGRGAVTARAVGGILDVSGQRVCQWWADHDGMNGLRRACEEQARREGNVSILAQLGATSGGQPSPRIP